MSDTLGFDFDIDYDNVIEVTAALKEMSEALNECTEAAQRLHQEMKLLNEYLEVEK